MEHAPSVMATVLPYGHERDHRTVRDTSDGDLVSWTRLIGMKIRIPWPRPRPRNLRPTARRRQTPGTKWSGWRPLAILLIAGLAVTPIASATAQEPSPRTTPYVVADTVGDVIYRRGDVTAIRIDHSASRVVLRFRTRLGSNPTTSANWRAGETRFTWDIDTDGDGEFNYWGWADTTDGGRYQGELLHFGGAHACDVTPGWYDHNGYSFGFPRSCIGDPASIRARMIFVFDASISPGGRITDDAAPNNGRWTASVRPS